jgi:hypothetical protein
MKRRVPRPKPIVQAAVVDVSLAYCTDIDKLKPMVADPRPLKSGLLAMRSSPAMAALADKLIGVATLLFPIIRYSKATGNARKSQMQVAHDIEKWVRFL